MAQTNKAKSNKTSQKKRKTTYTKRARRLQREALYSALLILLVIILMVRFHSSPNHYKLVIYNEQAEMEEIQYYTSFKTAKREMATLIEQGAYNPAILDDHDHILAIRYGIVNFKTKTCGENTRYTLENSGYMGYTNGCYGADGAYLETNDAGDQVKFKQSGAVGWVDIDEIEIRNIHDENTVKSINHYQLVDGNIMHYATTDLDQSDYAIAINIGKSNTELAQTVLYSYDGHYFYDEFTQMIDDYRNNEYTHSINASAPYFNYFQFLSHRARSSYVSRDINWYISTYLGYQAKPSSYPPEQFESQLYDEGYSFVEAQNSYGVNAMMMLALAINESGFGRSEIAITKNNLFGHAAYDNAPDESASGYKDVASSIATHASVFLNNGYLNPCDQSEPDSSPSTCFAQSNNRYRGGYFGDKSSGMNMQYASDPYWGEKAAQYYRNMDTLLGGKDEVRYTIAILHNKMKTPLYAQPDTSSKVIFYTPMVEDYAVIVLGEVKGKEIEGDNTWYKIQSDGVLNNARSALIVEPENYNPNTDVVYIPKAYFK